MQIVIVIKYLKQSVKSSCKVYNFQWNFDIFENVESIAAKTWCKILGKLIEKYQSYSMFKIILDLEEKSLK